MVFVVSIHNANFKDHSSRADVVYKLDISIHENLTGYLSLQEIECERRRRDAETRDEVCQGECIIILFDSVVCCGCKHAYNISRPKATIIK